MVPCMLHFRPKDSASKCCSWCWQAIADSYMLVSGRNDVCYMNPMVLMRLGSLTSKAGMLTTTPQKQVWIYGYRFNTILFIFQCRTSATVWNIVERKEAQIGKIDQVECRMMQQNIPIQKPWMFQELYLTMPKRGRTKLDDARTA